MRTGAYARFSPQQARSLVSQRNVLDIVRSSQGSMEAGAVLGADDSGRLVQEFPAAGNPTTAQAKAAVGALKRVAERIKRTGVAAAVPPLAAGPVSALARGEAVVLRWPNGVAIQAAL